MKYLWKCPECDAQWITTDDDEPRFCGICAGDTGRDVKLIKSLLATTGGESPAAKATALGSRGTRPGGGIV